MKYQIITMMFIFVVQNVSEKIYRNLQSAIWAVLSSLDDSDSDIYNPFLPKPLNQNHLEDLIRDLGLPER